MATNTFNNGLANNVGTADALVYTCPAISGSETVVAQLDVTNISAGAINVTAWIDRGGTKYHLCFGTVVPVNNTLQVVYGQKVVLKNIGGVQDKIYVKSNVAASADVVCSVVEDV